MRRLVLLGALALAMVSVACSSTTAPTCSPYEPEVAGTKVARAEVDAILETSCSFTTCHGRSPGSGKLWLPKRSDGDWRAEVVDVVSVRNPTMKRVSPGNPSASFLVQKVHGKGLCALEAQCTNGTCGQAMPAGGDPLPDAEIKTIAEWVRQGAAAD